jgi:hypothetical protein
MTEGLLHGYLAEHRFEPGEVEIYLT